MSLQSVDEDSGSPEIVPLLPTPRETPQPDGHSNGPEISDSLFDHPEVLLKSGDTNPNRVYTAESGNPLLTAVDKSGIFEIEIGVCICSHKDNQDEQLLQSGLFPATFMSIKTLFTFSVLEDFLKDNLECKTTAQQYYSKLQSMTSKMFPNLVPVGCSSIHISLLVTNGIHRISTSSC